jgi:hypothetical protein
VPHADGRSADETDVVVTHEKSYAAGIPAVLVSLRRGLEQMGALRTARMLLKLNQRNGLSGLRLAGDPRAPQARGILRERCQGGR